MKYDIIIRNTKMLAPDFSVRDSVDIGIAGGKIVMKNRTVLTLDEEKIMFEAKRAMRDISERAGF